MVVELPDPDKSSAKNSLISACRGTDEVLALARFT